MFLSAEDFVGEMPKEYKVLTDKVYEAFKSQTETYIGMASVKEDKPEKFEECKKKYLVLKDWYEDMLGCTRTIENYYVSGGDWSEKYCVLARICGTEPFRHGSIVERLVMQRLDAIERGIELGSDDEFEARIEEAFPRLWGFTNVDEKTEASLNDVLLRGQDATRNF